MLLDRAVSYRIYLVAQETLLQRTERLKRLRLEREKAEPKRQSRKPLYKLEDKILFGKKHMGRTISWIIENDIDWLTWAMEIINDFELSPEAEREYNAFLDLPQRLKWKNK